MISDPRKRKRFSTVTYNKPLTLFTLQLIDKLTLFKKEDVMSLYEIKKDDENIEELLLKKSVYPNGDELGFYNISKFNLKDFFEKELTEDEFKEYILGFNKEVRDLFNLFDEDLYDILIDCGMSSSNNDFDFYDDVINKENIESQKELQDYYIATIEQFLELDRYINYEELSNSLIKILFENKIFDDTVSILHINATNTILFSCLDYIKNKNPSCNVELCCLTNLKDIEFAFTFLGIINKISYKFIHQYSHKGIGDCNEMFDYKKDFDYIIQSDENSYSARNSTLKLSDYNLNVSSRIIKFLPFFTHVSIKEYLDNDSLESLILIPYKKPKHIVPGKYQSIILLILDYDKSNDRKGHFLAIDMEKNKEMTFQEISLENYRNLISSQNIYENSYKLFSNFKNDNNSKIFENNVFLNENMGGRYDFSAGQRIGFVPFNFNEEMYENKMKSQKEYYKIEYLEGDTIKTLNLNYPIEKLGNLIEGIYYQSIDTSEKRNFLYFPKFPQSHKKKVLLDFEINNPKSYDIYELTSDKISLDYLYYYLNSQMGINEYEYFNRGSGHRVLEKIRVPVPAKHIQEKIVESMNRSENFFKEVDQLKNKISTDFFNFKENFKVIDEIYGKREYSEETEEVETSESWLYTYRSLIWPLAITYLVATSGGFEKTGQANNLLRLFEFTTAFNSYVLISGIPDEIYENKKHTIWKRFYDDESDDGLVEQLKLSFGSWVIFHLKINKIYKKQFHTEINKEFYLKLVNKRIRDLYEKTKNARNDEFHNGIVNEEEAESFMNELNTPKNEIFEYLNSCYKNFKLYYNLSSNNARKDNKIIYKHNVMFLNGPYSMPIYKTIDGEEPLEPEALYLHDVQNNKFAKLDERLVKFIPVNKKNRDWRLYIFIGIKTDDDGNKTALYRNYLRSKDIIEESIDSIYDLM